MHNSTSTPLRPIASRTVIVTASSAVATLAMGFAPFPQFWFILAVALVVTTITIATGPKATGTTRNRPLAGLAILMALVVLTIRGTSLVWAVVPVLAFVVATVVWLIVSNRYAQTAESVTQQVAPKQVADQDKLAPKRDEKTAATNDTSSATAA